MPKYYGKPRIYPNIEPTGPNQSLRYMSFLSRCSSGSVAKVRVKLDSVENPSTTGNCAPSEFVVVEMRHLAPAPVPRHTKARGFAPQARSEALNAATIGPLYRAVNQVDQAYRCQGIKSGPHTRVGHQPRNPLLIHPPTHPPKQNFAGPRHL